MAALNTQLGKYLAPALFVCVACVVFCAEQAQIFRGTPNIDASQPFSTCDLSNPTYPRLSARIFSLIVALLLRGGPSAILIVIAVVIVDAVDSSVFWLLAHINQEIGKYVPSLADRDSTTAVAIKSVIARVFAPPQHVPPDAVRSSRAFRMAAIVAMYKTAISRSLPAQATAAPRVPSAKTGFRRDARCSAVTKAFEVVFAARFSHYHQASIAAANPVFLC